MNEADVPPAVAVAPPPAAGWLDADDPPDAEGLAPALGEGADSDGGVPFEAGASLRRIEAIVSPTKANSSDAF